ncbi:MAG: hypothetical protein M1829_001390 [Trizodia sp. TS-e1964]|nr:MAG: hypothetical protein M1829_001390 [Trizodia sp. TS-e1964]
MLSILLKKAKEDAGNATSTDLDGKEASSPIELNEMAAKSVDRFSQFSGAFVSDDQIAEVTNDINFQEMPCQSEKAEVFNEKAFVNNQEKQGHHLINDAAAMNSQEKPQTDTKETAEDSSNHSDQETDLAPAIGSSTLPLLYSWEMNGPSGGLLPPILNTENLLEWERDELVNADYWAYHLEAGTEKGKKALLHKKQDKAIREYYRKKSADKALKKEKAQGAKLENDAEQESVG